MTPLQMVTLIAGLLSILGSVTALAISVSKLGATIQKLTDKVESFDEVKADVRDLKACYNAMANRVTRLDTLVDERLH